MADPLVLLDDLFAPAFEAVAGRRVDPVVRSSDRADAQVNGALALAKELGRPPREIATAVARRDRSDGGRHRRDRRARAFINITFRPEFLAAQLLAASVDERPRGAAGGHREDDRRRLLGTERRQGDARRPPALDGDRRRARPDPDVPRSRRRPGEPHRRLGHAVRDADRAPRSTSARTAHSRNSRSVTSTASTARRGSSSTPARRSRTAAGNGSSPSSPPTRRPSGCGSCSSTSRRTTSTTSTARLGVLLTDDDLRGESVYDPLLSEVVEPARQGRPAGRVRRRRRRLPAGVHQPRGRTAAADRPEGRWRFQLRHLRPGLRDRPGRAARCRPRPLRRRRRPGSALPDGLRRRPDGGLDAGRRRGGPRRVRQRARPRPQDAQQPQRRDGQADRPARRGSRPGPRRRRREEPGPARRRARSGSPRSSASAR